MDLPSMDELDRRLRRLGPDRLARQLFEEFGECTPAPVGSIGALAQYLAETPEFAALADAVLAAAVTVPVTPTR